MNKTISKAKRTPRTLKQRAEAIFKIITEESRSFPKSRLKRARLSPQAIDNWLELIIYIQDQARIVIKEADQKTRVEKIEGKFSIMSRDTFLDDTQPLETRLLSLNDYAKSIIVQQLLLKGQ